MILITETPISAGDKKDLRSLIESPGFRVFRRLVFSERFKHLLAAAKLKAVATSAASAESEEEIRKATDCTRILNKLDEIIKLKDEDSLGLASASPDYGHEI